MSFPHVSYGYLLYQIYIESNNLRKKPLQQWVQAML